MPGQKEPGPAVKDAEVFEAVRDDGASKEKAAAIANAGARRSRSSVDRLGGRSESYEDQTVGELRRRAKEPGRSGYSHQKSELVSLLRKH